MNAALKRALLQCRPASIVAPELTKYNTIVLDLSQSNQALQNHNINSTEKFEQYIQQQLNTRNAIAGIGGYGEDRTLYQRSPLFGNGKETRTIHLAIDIWLPAGFAVMAPLNSKVHSFKDNHSFGNYGPTVILEHELEGIRFYSLYGHLSKTSLHGLTEGQHIKRGTQFATIGTPEENVGWPTHVHFQLITDMQGNYGDFIGVCHHSEAKHYLQLCPNPNWILQYNWL